MKKRIMIFGDSNTWGWNPANDLVNPLIRWDDDTRWAGVMQKELGDDYLVIPEGLNGRTSVWDDPIEEYRCGKDQIIPCLDSHAPIDLCIIFVGTNDHFMCRGLRLSGSGAVARIVFRSGGLLHLVCRCGSVAPKCFRSRCSAAGSSGTYEPDPTVFVTIRCLDGGALQHRSCAWRYSEPAPITPGLPHSRSAALYSM